MPVKKTKEETIKRLQDFLGADKICNLYDESFINWAGTVNQGTQKYTEVIAEYLLRPEIFARWGEIEVITREKSYDAGHSIDYVKAPYDGTVKVSGAREEELRAKAMLHDTIKNHGKIIDYQTPLKNERNDGSGRKIGKIDLLMYDERNNYAYILEYKRPDSRETLLRCVLEVYTYFRTVDRCKLRNDFAVLRENGAVIRKGVLLHAGSYAAEEYYGDNPFVKKLKTELGVEVFILD